MRGFLLIFNGACKKEKKKKKMGEKEETRKRAGSGREELSGRAVCGLVASHS